MGHEDRSHAQGRPVDVGFETGQLLPIFATETLRQALNASYKTRLGPLTQVEEAITVLGEALQIVE
jgi:hypothetical protein